MCVTYDNPLHQWRFRPYSYSTHHTPGHGQCNGHCDIGTDQDHKLGTLKAIYHIVQIEITIFNSLENQIINLSGDYY